MRAVAALLLSLALLLPVFGLDNGKAITPPRGWRSWNLFGSAVSQTLLQEVADALVSRARTVDGVPTSLADLGYSDLGLDDAWQAEHSGPGGVGFHDKDGNPIVNLTKFPDMASLVQYAHARNLTAGFYLNNCISSDPSGNLSHFLGDVAAFKRFGFDNIKLDSCSGQKDIALWTALLPPSTGIENCHNGPYFPQHPYKPRAPAWCPFNFYRTSVDVEVLYSSIMAINLQSTLEFSRQNLSFPGCWAYPDMLEVGVTAGLHKGEVDLTHAEARAHFGAWAITSSPLVLGLDVRNDSVVDSVWDIISNREALAVSQEYAGGAGTLLAQASANATFPFCGSQYSGGCSVAAWQVFSKPLPAGGAAVLVLNHADAATAAMALPLASIPGLAAAGSGSASVRDVWARADLPPATGGQLDIPAVASHDSVFFRLAPV